MKKRINGVKRVGCGNPACEPCQHITARARAFGPSNVYVAITPSEYRLIQHDARLAALAARIDHAINSCAKREG